MALGFPRRPAALAFGAGIALFFVLSRPGQAQDRQVFKFEVRGGAAFPAGDLGDVSDPGISAGLGLGFLITPRLALRADGDVSLLSEPDALEELEADITLWHYGGGLEYNFADPRRSNTSFLVGLGAGATTIDPEEEAAIGVEGETETSFTANGSVGIGFGGENVSFLIRGRAYAIFVEPVEVVDGVQEDDTDIWWVFPLQAGLEFRLP